MERITLDNLAHALKGVPRDDVVAIETLDGVKPRRMVRPRHGHLNADGTATTGRDQGMGYMVILST
jgi:hypothetical protein